MIRIACAFHFCPHEFWAISNIQLTVETEWKCYYDFHSIYRTFRVYPVSFFHLMFSLKLGQSHSWLQFVENQYLRIVRIWFVEVRRLKLVERQYAMSLHSFPCASRFVWNIHKIWRYQPHSSSATPIVGKRNIKTGKRRIRSTFRICCAIEMVVLTWNKGIW